MRYAIALLMLVACAAFGQLKLTTSAGISVLAGRVVETNAPSGNTRTNGLYGHWNFDSNLVDVFGGHDFSGTVNYGTGLVTNSFTNDYTGTPTIAGLGHPGIRTNSFSAILWYKHGGTDYNILFSKWVAAGYRGFILWYVNSTGDLSWGVSTNATSETYATINITLTTWNMIYVFRDTARKKLGISHNNGAVSEIDMENFDINDNGADLKVGYGEGGYWGIGSYDLLSIYDRVLTSDEVTAHYNSGAGKSYPFQ